MEKMNVCLASKTVSLSEYKNYLELVNRVCYYNEPNGNSVRLPYDDSTLEKAKTLEGMPVYAKYTVNSKGQPTFKGHEVSVDANGELVFNTAPIGTHVEVYIQDDTVELADKRVMTLPCLFAKQKIWKRNKAVCNAAMRLYEEGNLHNSWEISSFKYEYENGVKTLLEYVFDGNTFLGEGVSPAFGEAAKVISLSSEENELLIAEALSKDLIEASENPTGSEVIDMEDEKTLDTSAEEVNTGGVENGEEEGKETSASNEEAGAAEGEEEKVEPEQVEKAALTMNDIRLLVEGAVCRALEHCPDMIWIFSENHIVWSHTWDEKETDIYEFDYSIENDEVVLSAPRAMTLVVSPRAMNASFDEKASALIDAQKQIAELTTTVNELQPFKSAAEQAAREKAEAQRQEAIASLRKYAEESGMVSKEELDSGEIAEMLENLNETGIKVMIADRIVEKGKKSKPAPETASQKQPKVRMVLSDGAPADSYSVLKDFLHR